VCRAWVDDRPARRVSRGRKGQRHRIQPRLRAPVLQAVVRRASCRFRPRIARRTMVAIWDRSPHSARNVITKACEKMGRSVDLAAIPAAAGGGYTGGKAPRRYKKGRRLEIDAAGDGTTGVEHNICMYRGRRGGIYTSVPLLLLRLELCLHLYHINARADREGTRGSL